MRAVRLSSSPNCTRAPSLVSCCRSPSPTPVPNMVPASIGQALGSDRHGFLVCLDIYAASLVVIASICAVLFLRHHGFAEHRPSLHLIGASSIFLSGAGFCFRSSASPTRDLRGRTNCTTPTATEDQGVCHLGCSRARASRIALLGRILSGVAFQKENGEGHRTSLGNRYSQTR